MTTSRIPAVVNQLVTGFTGATTAKVYNGRWVTVPDGDYVTVGWTPDDEGTSGQQVWAGLGNKARNETIDVPCYVESHSGATDVATRRDAAFAIFASLENYIRTDPTLGGIVPNPGWSQIGNYNDRIEQTETGLTVGVVFHVLVQARI